MEQNSTLFERLVQAAAPGGRLLRAWPLKGGISAQMTALEIELPGGKRQKWVVRQPGRGSPQAPSGRLRIAETEFRLLQMARSQGIAVPAPLFLDASGVIFPSPCLVTGYVEGEVDFSPVDSAGCALQMADTLARIHALSAVGLDLSFLPPPGREFAGDFLRQPEGTDGLLNEESIREALKAAWPLPPRNEPVLLHGDYWPGNILWRGGRLAAVIDWEDACLGDPLIDLAVCRLDLLWIYGAQAMETFTQHYLSLTKVDPSSLPNWDLCAALRLARLAGSDLGGWAGFFHPYGRDDITAESIHEAYRLFVGQAKQNKLISE